MRDAAEAGLIDVVWCWSSDRPARVYTYQVIVLDELARHGVAVLFADAPAIEDGPRPACLPQVQGVIAQYERAETLSVTGAASSGGPGPATSSPGRPLMVTAGWPRSAEGPPRTRALPEWSWSSST